ncbi:MAG: TIGR03936 family radical SAM-associated protein [Actinobacteria bacterium]|nr:TIGR03936 family radical SAM-associated protein [Actinomycetota bacterium]
MSEASAEKFIYRITMKKVGAAKFISHLDLLDILKSAVSCADIPVQYSRGFNPTMKMNYSYPLPVGVSGQNEIFDLFLTKKVSSLDMVHNINNYLMNGIRIIEVRQVEKKSSIIGRQNTKVRFVMTLLKLDDGDLNPEAVPYLISEILSGDNVDDIDVKYFMGGIVRISFKLDINSKLKLQKFLSGLVTFDGRVYRIANITRVGLVRDQKSLMG